MLKTLTLCLFICSSVWAQTPPTKVPQPDGTIQLVPVPPAMVYTPYFIDPTMQYQLYLTSGHTNKSWDGRSRNGSPAYKDSTLNVDILTMPYVKTKFIDGKAINLWSVYRSVDAVISFDHTRLELAELANGSGFDTTVMDPTKSKWTVLGDGLIMYHAEALKAPELRGLRPLYYQWNFDGLLWAGGYRKLGQLKFRVKDDYYLPTWGIQKSFVRLLPSAVVGNNTYVSKVDGSPTPGTNVLRDIHSECEDVIFGVSPSYKVSHFLAAPSSLFQVGDTVRVQIKLKPETKPQMISAVATNIIWDPNHLELMSLDKTGSPPYTENAFSMTGVGNINESMLPKDGNASHNFFWKLGNKTYVSGEVTLATLVFRVNSDFNHTAVEIVQKNDARLVGLFVLNESQPLGSSIPGASVLGVQTPSVIINGILP